VWATGAEPQKVTAKSNLAILNHYFKVNDFLQSTSHPNVFGGGDCITIENYFKPNERLFPPKAGVYAVREGPIVAQNLVSFLAGETRPYIKYVPQSGFLALLMTGDGSAVGSKFGIAFSGKWVWRMKDHIDRGFMKLFAPENLFTHYDYTKTFAEQKATLVPVENADALFEEEKSSERAATSYKEILPTP
jgi:selenide,water dikinase